MATATITRIDTGKIDGGKTGTDRIGADTIDWRARADRIAGEIAEAAARHDADDSFVSEGYQRLKGRRASSRPSSRPSSAAPAPNMPRSAPRFAASPRAAARRRW